MPEKDGRKFEYMKRLEYHDITHARHRILTVFWNHTDKNLENAFPSRELVAAKAKVSLTTLDSGIKWAKDNGYLEVQREATSHKPVTYKLPMPADLSPRDIGEELDGSPTIGEAQRDSPTIGEGGSPVSGEGGSPTIGGLTDPLPDPVSDPPPNPPAQVQQERGPDAKGGDSFQEWIDLFPGDKRMRPRDIQAHYAETIKGTDPALLLEATRAYISSLSEPRFISQASKVLETRMWDKPEFKPKPDQNLLNIEILRLNRDRVHAPDSEQWKWETEMIEMEEQKLIDRQGYIRGADGNLRRQELTPEQRKSRADSLRRNEYLRYA